MSDRTLIAGQGNLQCLYGCAISVTTIAQMSYICTDFSTTENWSFGERQLTYNFSITSDTTVTIGYLGYAWVRYGDWNVSTTFSLIVRNDTGQINSSPRAITAPVIRLQGGCNHTIPLAVSDPDGDIIRCRWAVGSECVSICNAFLGAELDSESCTIRYEANRGSGYQGVALMIEDFLPGSLQPLSSVALQFLVFIVHSSQSCSQQPQFVHPTLPQGICVAIPSGETFITQVTVDSGSSSASITEIETISPIGTSRGELQHIPNTSIYYINITWTPELNQQNQTYVLCFTAINSAGLSSEQLCVQLLAGHFPPMAISLNLQLVSPSNITLYIKFDEIVERPTIIANIIIYELYSGMEVYRIDASLSPEVTFNASRDVKIMPIANHLFTEKTHYYITIERGAVRGLGGCGPSNEPVVNNNTWTFEVLDETPPAITFIDGSTLSNGNITLSWRSNENTTWRCNLINGMVTYMVDCSDGEWSGYDLDEGTYGLQINATDDAGNVATLAHIFNVDKTPPSITITQRPLPVSLQIRPTLRFRCNEICTFVCWLSFDTQDLPLLCRNGILNTPTLLHNVSYTVSVIATDQIGNIASPITYTWETDFVSPVIFGVSNTSAPCTDTSTNQAGQAQATDDKLAFPSVVFHDFHQGCSIRRTWTATDDAGNSATLDQIINVTFSPSLSFLPQVSFSCDSTSSSVIVPRNTATAPNPCRLPLELGFNDSVNEHMCPSSFTRNWTVNICSQTISELQRINLYDLCPPNACSRNENPPRGICSLGECQCIRPWFGENCSILIYNPVIEPVNDLILQEAQQYSVTLNISQGTPPLSWSLTSGPSQLRVDQLSGQVIWNRVQVGNHSITVQVENQVGRSYITWTLQVQPGYSTILNTISPVLFPQAQPIILSGMVEYIPNNIVQGALAGIVPVFIDILNDGATRTLRTFTNTDGNFSVTFYPSVIEYGSYQARSRHPFSSQYVSQIRWDFLGFSAAPNRIVLSGEAVNTFNETFYNATILCNDGPGALSGLTATSSLSNSEMISIDISIRGQQINNNNIQPGGKLMVDIQLAVSQPLNGFFTIIIRSAKGTTLQLSVDFQIEPILPCFLIEPPSVNTRIIRGPQGSRIFQFNVTNIGRTIASNVRPLLPNTEFITFISFRNLQNRNTTGLTLENGESAILLILVQTTASQQLGDISSSIVIISTQVSSSISIRLTVSSNILLNFTVVVEDEFTYFASGRPLVNNAAVTLINYQRNIRITQTTEMDNGTVTFFNIPEDRYELHAEAPDHLSIRQIIVTSFNDPVITIFLQRQTVTYTWSVTPIQFQDNYVITVEADFVTHVPIPIITVSPEEIDLEELELGFVSSFQLNITNQGLIRANESRIQFPNNHPFLEFNSTNTELGFIEPLSSVTVTVHVSRRNIQKRVSIIWIIYAINIYYNYVCGDLITRVVPVVLRRQEIIDTPRDQPIPNRITCVNCGSGGYGTGEIFFNFIGYTARTPAFCNACIQSILGCAPTPNFPLAGCIPLIAAGVNPLSSLRNALSWISCIVSNDFLGELPCLDSLLRDCLGGSGNTRRKRNIDRTVNELAASLYPILQSINLGIEVLGDRAWLSVGDEIWLSQVLQPTIDDNSEDGTLISMAEFSTIIAAPPPNRTTIELVENMIIRLNNTMHSWNNGQLEPSEELNITIASFSKVQQLSRDITTYNEIAIDKGFLSYLDAYNFASSEVNRIERWEDEAGVCAVVRIRIEQELAVTRTAFLAELEIENMESSPLENGSLEIVIVESGTGQQATHLFAIGNSSFSGLLTDNGDSWLLPSEMSGSISTLIIPLSEAAPVTDRTYDVGGTLTYSLNGENITIPLLPTLITVTPDPSLRVHYFWERYVVGDDPFTDEVENSLPFTLGVAVKNAGHGIANTLQITSGQPEIIENERGLLINFMIISAMIGNGSVNPSLTVMFGDLAPNTTIVARWQMISSLQGEFRNYSATFENINPLGDPNLSILDELEIHELIRNVRIYNSPEEDDVQDFLVNKQDDFLAYPDTLYSSKTLQHFNVSSGVVLSVHTVSIAEETILSVSTYSNATDWVYYRYEDTQGIFRSIVPFNRVVKQEDNHIVSLPPENFWITRDRDSDSRTDTFYLHLVDSVTSIGETVFNISLCASECLATEMLFVRPPTGKCQCYIWV